MDTIRFNFLLHSNSSKWDKISLGLNNGRVLYCMYVCMYVGVSEELLKELNVRLVAIDRPGYGESDKHPQQTYATFAKDIDELADLLELGEKIWLLGYSCGGAYCWGAAYYIPDRIAGIAMWAPVGNYWWKVIQF